MDEVKGMDQSRLKGTEMDRSGHKWADWTESDRMDQMDWSELKWIEMLGHCGLTRA